MLTIKSFLTGLLSLLLVSAVQAENISTGDLGLNIIKNAGIYEWSPTVTPLTNGTLATVTVSYGLWNSPEPTVHTLVNGTEVGSFVVSSPFPDGAVTTTFTFSNLLVDGVNTIRLDGGGPLGAEDEYDYVISRIDLTYNIPVLVTNPPPTNEPPSGAVVSKVLHYLNRPALTPLAGSTVSGTVRLQLNEQGNSSLQKVDLNAAGLQANASYFLVVVRGDDPTTNSIGTVASDTHGRVKVSFEKGNGSGDNLPAELDPVTDIHGIGLAETADTQAIVWSIVNTSSSFQYLVERNLAQQDTNASPVGSISLEANANSVNFRLLAGGLSANTIYYLALNGSVVANATSDSEGALEITTWPAGAPAVLDLRALSLLDGSDNVLLSTTLPK